MEEFSILPFKLFFLEAYCETLTEVKGPGLSFKATRAL